MYAQPTDLTQPNPTHVGWIGLVSTHVIDWVKNFSSRTMHSPTENLQNNRNPLKITN